MKAPFPYFGGKSRAAPIVWEALGDVGGYVEPFAGSAAVLLNRPHTGGRRTETLNDADGWLVNTWRSIQLSPDDVAEHAWGPVTEIDYHARLAWLQERRDKELVAWLEGDPEHHDPKAAGWWLYVMACGIGDPFGKGPWRVIDGHLRNMNGDAGQGVNRELPHLGNAGQGVNRGLPHLGDAGKGALRAYMGALSDRLSSVRITCGDWKRLLNSKSAMRATAGNKTVGVFLDPPYSTSGDLYAESASGISDEVLEWCVNANPEWRIVICGYNGDNDELLAHGWTKQSGKKAAGQGYSRENGYDKVENLWLSPACIHQDLFAVA